MQYYGALNWKKHNFSHCFGKNGKKTAFINKKTNKNRKFSYFGVFGVSVLCNDTILILILIIDFFLFFTEIFAILYKEKGQQGRQGVIRFGHNFTKNLNLRTTDHLF